MRVQILNHAWVSREASDASLIRFDRFGPGDHARIVEICGYHEPTPLHSSNLEADIAERGGEVKETVLRLANGQAQVVQPLVNDSERALVFFNVVQ